MTAAQIHLALNHIPVLGALLGAVLLAYGLWRGQETVQNVSLGLLVVVGAVAVAVYLTGEPAEEIIEGAAGVSTTPSRRTRRGDCMPSSQAL